MKKSLTALLAALAIGAGTSLAFQATAAEVVDVYKSPYCGCCSKWIDHLKAAGFEVRSHEVNDVPATRQNRLSERLVQTPTASRSDICANPGSWSASPSRKL